MAAPAPFKPGTTAQAFGPQPPLSSAKAAALAAPVSSFRSRAGALSQQPCPPYPLPSRNLLQEPGASSAWALTAGQGPTWRGPGAWRESHPERPSHFTGHSAPRHGGLENSLSGACLISCRAFNSTLASTDARHSFCLTAETSPRAPNHPEVENPWASPCRPCVYKETGLQRETWPSL